MSKTNYEHYQKELIVSEFIGKECDFIRDRVLGKDCCKTIGCAECLEKVAEWLDKPYQIPKVEINWEKVPVDTIVFASNDLNDDGTLSYKWLRCFKEKAGDMFCCFNDGCSSYSTSNSTKWKYCELAHPADIEKYKKQ